MSLTEQQRKFAEGRFAGLSVREAALAAGCPEKTASQAGSRLEKHPNVMAHLERLKGIESDTNPVAGRDVHNPNAAPLAPVFEDPKEFLQAAMNDRTLDPKMRMQAAIALLPFEHQKLGESGKKEQKDSAAQNAVTGRFAPATPPPTQLKLVR